jgi:Tfp pilus assembly protein PilF
MVYSRSLFCGFVRDDFPQIVNNRQVQSWEYLPQLLGSHLWSQSREEPTVFYRPIFSVWMLLIHTFGGLDLRCWHFSSILLQVAATYLVFRLCRRLTTNELGAAAAAAIFAVHPIHVDGVTWVSASCELLFTICSLLAMLMLFRSDEGAEPRVWVSAVLFGAGILAKETGMVMLTILPVIAWIQLKSRAEGKKRFWKAGSPYGIVAVGYLLIRLAVLHRVGTEAGEHSWAQVIFTAPSLLLFYMKKLFLPWNLAGCYVNPITASPSTAFWLQLSAIVTSLAAIAWSAIHYRSRFGLAAALIVIPVLPTLGVVRIYQQGDMSHDRYLYLPSVGLSLLVAMLMAKLWPRGKPARMTVIGPVVAVLVAFSVQAISQQKYYQDDPTFYARVLEVSPTDAFAMTMLGNVYLDQKQNDLALEQFRRANQIAPDNQKITLLLARGLFVAEKYRDAETVLNDLLQTPKLNPRRRESTLLSLANVEISLGNLTYAQQLLERVKQSDDRFPQLHWAWGVLYQRQGMLSQALAEYKKEFEITGDELAQQRSASVAKLIYSQSAAGSSTESGGR